MKTILVKRQSNIFFSENFLKVGKYCKVDYRRLIDFRVSLRINSSVVSYTFSLCLSTHLQLMNRRLSLLLLMPSVLISQCIGGILTRTTTSANTWTVWIFTSSRTCT